MLRSEVPQSNHLEASDCSAARAGSRVGQLILPDCLQQVGALSVETPRGDKRVCWLSFALVLVRLSLNRKFLICCCTVSVWGGASHFLTPRPKVLQLALTPTAVFPGRLAGFSVVRLLEKRGQKWVCLGKKYLVLTGSLQTFAGFLWEHFVGSCGNCVHHDVLLPKEKQVEFVYILAPPRER